MSTFYQLKVKEIKRETEESVSVAFELPNEVAEQFNFVPGQYLTLETEINGENVRRAYSICSAPGEDLRVGIKKVKEGKFSSFANDVLKVGDELSVMPPMGNFAAPIDAKHAKHYIGFAAGSGITPILSIAKSVLKNEPLSKVSLFYNNKSTGTVMFREELDALKNKYTERFSLHHLLSKEHPGTELYFGRMNTEKLGTFKQFFFDNGLPNEFYLCGPFSMVEEIKGFLLDHGYNKEQVHFELFSTADVKPQNTSSDDEVDVVAKMKIILDEQEQMLEVPSQGESVLDVALNSGMDVPYACKGAVCMTCKAKVLEGTVKMDMNYALTDEEVEDGYVLTCQTHPTSENVCISFDD